MQRYLAIYLQDHLAGATAGVELVRRMLRENESSEYAPVLRELVEEIAEDRATLLRVMRRLDVPPSRTKIAVAWAAEKAGRLKLNGQITGYSPLSRLLELEGLSGGIEAKRSLWVALEETESPSLREFDLPQLVERARSQQERLEPLRKEAAHQALVVQ